MKGIILQGSARNNGNTQIINQLLINELGFDILNLNEKKIGQYDYEFKNHNDDFLPIIREIANNYDVLVFSTPVYWYSMSGIMKTFFDRITDCLKTEKETGRKLRGKLMAAVSCGSDREETGGFFIPFQKSAAYLGMHYIGNIHTWVVNQEVNAEVKKRINDFSQQIKTYTDQI